MFEQIDLRALSEIQAGERAVLSLYFESPRALERLERRIKKLDRMLQEHPAEQAYLAANMRLVHDYLEQHPLSSGGLVIFACDALDEFHAFELALDQTRLARFEACVWLDASPYVRPLAELMDEYETYAVVLADNAMASVYVVSASRAVDEIGVVGNIKNHVKKGGWSQQRYKRRRDKQLGVYAGEVIAALEELDRRHLFDRILLVGSDESVREISGRLPQRLAERVVASKVIETGRGAREQARVFAELFAQTERASERELWEQIQDEYARQGRAVVGVHDVHAALRHGRAAQLLLARDAKILGAQCRACEAMMLGEHELCSSCGTSDLFEVDAINEFVELASTSGARVEFADHHAELDAVDGVAALLRY